MADLDPGRAKASAAAVVDSARDTLVGLSRSIHERPELCFEEYVSSDLVADVLADSGLAVTRGISDLPTALEARAGSGPLQLVICAEYDALPGIGHACGHNLIAASAVGATLALAPLADDLGISLRLLGTPAEEGGGGKILLLDRGAFAGAHAAMMVHPWPSDHLGATCLAVDHFTVTYRGRDAHASASPERGINAGDAFVVAQVAIGLIRQHLERGNQVHGIVDSGGSAPNVVPDLATGRYMIRALSLEDLDRLRPRILSCFQAGASATGATLETESLAPVYSHFEPDGPLLSSWRANAEELGRSYAEDDAGLPLPTISTDMANVSLAVPSIHPLLGIQSGGAVNHQPEFAAACLGPSAELALRDGAVGMAWTAIDAASDPDLRDHLLARSA
jgi:amidohydrolase